ncbi:hypothetical protein LA080_008338 [Diaporthe eres]|uniref:Uncharacterized protein n=1 Tax=Diaporthe vaccinii TaxID=105482 RepID=A0ABR4E182_9PEZI|nr:hypothetical protein LA080_008338 [Diaporthe eres]
MRVQVGSVLVFLFHLAALVIATGRSGAYERIYFWYAYNLLMDDNPGQKVILGFIDRKGDDWLNNKGSGPGKRLTWYEFMERFDNRDRGNCQVDPPGEGRSIDQVAAELDKAGFDNAVNIRILSGKQAGKDKYGDYFRTVTSAVARARANGDKGESGSINGNNYRQWDYVEYVDKMRQSITAVSEIRRWEFNGKYIKWALAEKFNLWQEPVSDSTPKETRPFIDGVVLEDPVRLQYTGEDSLTAINMVETLRSSAVQDKIKAALENPKNWHSTLRTWLSDCGTFTGKGKGKSCHPPGSPEFPEYTKGHREVLAGVEESTKVIAKDASC